MINYGYAYTLPKNPATTRVVAIISVDPGARKAVGKTREHSEIHIDCSHAVAGVLYTPAVGEQWYVERSGMYYILQSRLPGNSAHLLTEVVPGQVQVGSSGPLTLHGSEVQVDSMIRLGSTLYRDTAGVLQRSTDEGQTWTPVCNCGGGS